MTAKLLKCAWGIISTALISLYLFILYELALVPAILEWSVYGVVLVLGLAGLLTMSLTKETRLSTPVLGMTFLLIVNALNNISSYPPIREAFATFFIFILLLVVGKLLGRFSIRRYTVVFLTALILTSTLDLSQARLWTEFFVKWESPSLYKRYATVDYFPVRLADVDGDGTAEIITQQNIKQAEEEKLQVAETGVKYQILEQENNHFAVYKWNGSTFKELSPDEYNIDKLKTTIPIDYLGYPFYETVNSPDKSKGIEQLMNPLAGRADLVENSTNFAAFPFQMLKLSQESLEAKVKSQSNLINPSSSSAVGEGELIPGHPPELVTIDHVLSVRKSADDNKPVGIIDNTMISDIGTSEIIIGDVDSDKTDELLLTSETSRILKLEKDGKWQVLWTSIDSLDEKARFQKFRFEDFAPLGKDKTPQIIALSKSYVRDNPTRYMTGYVYRDGALHQQWRAFSGLINLRAGDIDGDGENELIGYMYRAQRLFVLEKHNLPIVTAIYSITGLLIILGFVRQWRQRKEQSGGVQNA